MFNGKPILYKPGHHKVKNGYVLLQHPKECPVCGKTFPNKHNGAHYCSRACYWKARGSTTLPFNGRWGGKITDRSEFRVAASPRIQRLYLLKQRRACDLCGWGDYAEVLEVHHINHDKKDGRLENLQLICPTCHGVQHFLEKSGKYDATRYERAKKLRERLGLSILPHGYARTSLQALVDSGKLQLD